MVTDAYVELNGLRFHYREWGSDGQPVLLLHGLASTSHIWDLTAPLLNKDIQVLALDQRGHGKSDKPDDGYDFATILGDVRAFCRRIGIERPVVVGHSWGASVALQYAADYTEEVAGLAMVDGGFMEMSSRLTWEEAEQRLAPPQLDGLPLEKFLEMAQTWSGVGEMWSPDVEQIILANFEIGRDRTIRPRLRRANHMKILRSLWEQRSSQLYPLVRCPVLVAPARREPENDAERHWLLAKLEGIRALEAQMDHRLQVRWMEDSIHDVPVQRPQQLAAAINAFVAELAG